MCHHEKSLGNETTKVAGGINYPVRGPRDSQERFVVFHCNVKKDESRSPFSQGVRGLTDHDAVAVHGHTPTATPELRKNCIGIDTGAFFSGRLTCVALGEGKARFLRV